MKSRKLLFWVIVIAIAAIAFAANRSGKQVQHAAVRAKLLPGIPEFLDQHAAEFGRNVTNVKDMPDWAEGRRQQVQIGSTSYLFYVRGNEVVTVYRHNIDGSREEVWRK